MQHIATKIFIVASVVFGITGIIMVLIGSEPGDMSSPLRIALGKTLMTSVFIILPSFALSVASKYLNGK